MGSYVTMITCEKCGSPFGYIDDEYKDGVKTIGCDACGFKHTETYIVDDAETLEEKRIMNIPKLLEAYEDILRYNENEDTVRVAMAIDEFNAHMMYSDMNEQKCDHNFVLFNSVRSSFCDKCGAILPF